MKMKGQPNYVQSLILFVLDRFLEFKLLRSKREKNASPKPLPSLQQVDSTYYVYEKPTYNPLPGNSLTQLLLYCTQPSRSRKSQLQQEKLINWFQKTHLAYCGPSNTHSFFCQLLVSFQSVVSVYNSLKIHHIPHQHPNLHPNRYNPSLF